MIHWKEKRASIEHPSIEECSSGDENNVPMEHAAYVVCSPEEENTVPMKHAAHAACSSGDENSSSIIIHGSMDDPLERKISSQDIIDIQLFHPEVRSKHGGEHLHEGVQRYVNIFISSTASCTVPCMLYRSLISSSYSSA